MIGFLIGLPIRIAFGVFSLFLTVITVPLRFLIHNIWLLAILVVAAFIFYAFERQGPPAQLTPAATTAQPQAAAKGQKQIIIEPVLKREDGDSAFATDLYASMTDVERGTYSTYFFWAMSNQPSGKTVSWNGGNINGEFTPTDTFQNSRGAMCRHFKEMLKVHSVQQNISGIACEAGNGTWCKLKPNATPACYLGHKPSFFGDAMRGLKNAF